MEKTVMHRMKTTGLSQNLETEATARPLNQTASEATLLAGRRGVKSCV